MRALRCTQLGPPDRLVLEEVPDPQPGPGEVVVDVEGCGVNFPDTLMIRGQYQIRPQLPFSPGGEVCGTVSAVGDGVTALEIGERVLGLTGYGGMAEKVAVDARQLARVPDGVDPTIAAAFLFAYGTSYHALFDRGQLAEGDTLLVLGAAGGVGLAAVELGARAGARVIAAASTQAKLDLAREKGAVETVNYRADDFRARLMELAPDGLDVCYDPVGGDLAEQALRRMAWNGRYLVIGFAAGEIPRIPLNLVLLKGCQVVGVFWGAFTAHEPQRNAANTAELLRRLASGELEPHVSATFALDQAAEAIAVLDSRRALGKVVVVP